MAACQQEAGLALRLPRRQLCRDLQAAAETCATIGLAFSQNRHSTVEALLWVACTCLHGQFNSQSITSIGMQLRYDDRN